MDCIGAFPNSGSRTNSEGCQLLVKTWVDQCITSHRPCMPSFSSTSHMPSRLLDLMPGNKVGGYFAVVEGVSRGEDCRYACLSHCWGGDQPLKLTKDTAEELTNGLPVENLPPTFRDAVTVCGWLDIQYLWIDSLCILQDSEDDWKIQAFQMRSIFKNAYLTIAATYGSTCQSGLFNERNPVASIIPFGQVASLDSAVEDQMRSVTVVDTLLWKTAVENSPLNRRAWVMQVCPIPCRKKDVLGLKVLFRSVFSHHESCTLDLNSCSGSARIIKPARHFPHPIPPSSQPIGLNCHSRIAH